MDTTTAMPPGRLRPAVHSPHRGNPVTIGRGYYTVYAGGTRFLEPQDLAKFDIVIPFMTLDDPQMHPALVPVLKDHPGLREYPIKDFHGGPSDWPQFIGDVRRQIMDGKKVIGFCFGGHGRTGMFIASLIGLFEPSLEDPIAAARRRHCGGAVEMRVQAESVFGLRGQTLPRKYHWMK